MKTPTIVGIVLIIVGILVLTLGGFSITKREKVLDLGPMQASVDKKENFPVPPLLGYIAVVGGIVLVVVGARGGSR